MKALLRLYPAAWRERYEAEVAQLLVDSSSGIRDVPGLLHGAYDARRHPGRSGLPIGGIRGWFSRVHVAGLLAITGGALWFGTYVALWLAAMRMSVNPDLRSVALLAGAGPLLVVAIAGFLRRDRVGWRDRVLTGVALFTVATGASLMSVLLIRNGLSPDVQLVPYELDVVLLVGTALVLAGSLAAACGMWGRGIASRRALAWLAVSCVIDLVFLAIWVKVGFVQEVTSFAGAAAGMLVALGWMALGWSVIRRPVAAAPLAPADTLTAIA